ncbi:hypothetical protein [Paenibacillus graminis]|uniref:Thioredoxin domain-containing protein n=1 Tax=Paenibacillus graminis TaxID=189425 RepID=A0A089MGA9_9BACL|nr:hypothetical protein [Paenibacillus graminis]AIQ70533.1 hypothetical protein PGRAT_25025 [Paenibacillus graminis]
MIFSKLHETQTERWDSKEVLKLIQAEDLFKKFDSLLFLSMYCLTCMNILSSYEDNQQFFTDHKILLVLDCGDYGAMAAIKELYRISGPMTGTYETVSLQKLSQYKMPYVIKLNHSSVPNFIKIESWNELIKKIGD